MKGHWIPYTAAELDWIKERATAPRAETLRQFQEAFGRPDVSLQNLNSLCKRNGWMTGRTGCFERGSVAHNKGKKCAPGTGGLHPNARKTQFRKGERAGVAVKLYKPIGTERIVDGYLERKINDDFPARQRWRGVHLIRWEAINGPIPAGHALKCLDGNRLNTDPSNWECIPRGVLARLNGGRFKTRLAYDEAHPEVKPVVMAMAKLRHGAHVAKQRRSA